VPGALRFVSAKTGLPVAVANPQAASAAAKSLAAGAKEGYRVPASMVPGSSRLRRLAEALSPSAAKATAQAKNQRITDRLAAQAAELLPEHLSPAELATVRAKAGETAYGAVKKVPGLVLKDRNYATGLQELGERLARMSADVPGLEDVAKAQELVNAYRKSGAMSYEAAVEASKNLRLIGSRLANTRGSENMGRTARGIAALLDNLIDANLARQRPDLVGKIKPARELIAKTHMVEDALSEGSGHVNALQIGAADGVKTGPLKVVSDMAQGYRGAMAPGAENAPLAVPQAFDAAVALGGFTAFGPYGAALGLLRPIARNIGERAALVAGPKTPATLGQWAQRAGHLARGWQALREPGKSDLVEVTLSDGSPALVSPEAAKILQQFGQEDE
jgi:hypothetical protein